MSEQYVRLDLAFVKALAQGRQQLSRTELLVFGVLPSTLALAVTAGRLKEGVQGYWVPQACDPGFLTVVDDVYADAYDTRTDTLLTIDSSLVKRFG